VKSQQIFRLKGGTGNQLFIYFAAAMSRITSGRPVVLETTALRLAHTKREISLDLFNLPIPLEYIKFSRVKTFVLRFITYFMRKSSFKLKNSILFPSEVGYCENLESDSNAYLYIDGYFQTWRYFKNVMSAYPDWRPQLREESEAFRYFARKMDIENPIVIHVRRGDYVQLGGSFGLLSESYFANGIERLISKKHSDCIWAFSDDPKFVQSNFTTIKFDCFPELEESLTEEETLLLMSRSKRLVISNSTFSWWAAAFAGSSAAVIAPNPWFRTLQTPRDLIPDEWVTLGAIWSDTN
jgi:hypothetical protein